MKKAQAGEGWGSTAALNMKSALHATVQVMSAGSSSVRAGSPAHLYSNGPHERSMAGVHIQIVGHQHSFSAVTGCPDVSDDRKYI